MHVQCQGKPHVTVVMNGLQKRSESRSGVWKPAAGSCWCPRLLSRTEDAAVLDDVGFVRTPAPHGPTAPVLWLCLLPGTPERQHLRGPEDGD